MRLSSNCNKVEQVKAAMAKIAIDLNAKMLADKDKLSETQKQNISDALAIVTTVNSNEFTEEALKTSSMQFAKLVKAAFSEDVMPSEVRKKNIENAKSYVKEVTPRGVGEGKELASTCPETIANNYAEYTTSAIVPATIVERIVQSLTKKQYTNAQEAFDGYCQKDGMYVGASGNQKCEVARLLKFYGYKIDCVEWEKVAIKEKELWEKKQKAYEKITNEGGVSKKAEVITNDKKIVLASSERDTSLFYCTNEKCGKTTKHKRVGPNQYKCLNCGTVKEKGTGKKEAQLNVNIAPYDVIQIKSPDVGWEDYFVIKSKEEIQQAQSILTSGQINGKQIRLVNDRKEVKYPVEKLAISKEAQEWISKKIEYLIKEEGLTKEQAAGKAYGMAREKGFDIPKKGQVEGELFSFNDLVDFIRDRAGSQGFDGKSKGYNNDGVTGVEHLQQVGDIVIENIGDMVRKAINTIIETDKSEKEESQILNQLDKEGQLNEKEKEKVLGADPKELAMGIEVEKEHVSDTKITEKIALDHLKEDPQYYSHLKEMEDKHNVKSIRLSSKDKA
jgi:hypothetical protein